MYQNNQTIKFWAEEDRPREKLVLKGAKQLSTAELFAILLNSGYKNKSALDLSKEILSFCNNNLNELSKLNIADLSNFKGVGEAKAISIIAMLELANRKNSEIHLKKIKIISSNVAYQYIKGFFTNLKHEEFYVIFLNRANEIISCLRTSIGGLNGTIVDPRLIFKSGIECLATGIILAHNHPSGQLNPSDIDKNLTKKMVEIGKLMEISVLDHLIVTDIDYFSFSDSGIL
jgi:DNA repair protein RadC